MKCLFLITARGGSKGIPGKNIKPLAGKPLIYYSIDVARELSVDDDICVSTEDKKIISIVEDYNLKVPFIRPSDYSTDTAGSYEVLLHALEFYEKKGKCYDCIILLQPTSPFRKSKHIKEALSIYTNKIDMVISVKETKSNPYYSLYEENVNGFLEHYHGNSYQRRQDCPIIYDQNGAVYIINPLSLKKMPISNFKRIKKYVMNEKESIDLDTPLDWRFCEFLIQSERLNNLI